MQLNRFDLNLLIALDALIHEEKTSRGRRASLRLPARHERRAAEAPEYFNDQLLVRVGRDMELTPRGLSLVEPVREALLRIQATLGTQPSFDPGTVATHLHPHRIGRRRVASHAGRVPPVGQRGAGDHLSRRAFLRDDAVAARVWRC